MIKKYSFLVLALALLVVGGAVVSAQTSPTPTPTPTTNHGVGMGMGGGMMGPLIVNIGPDGHALLRGKIVSVDTASNSLVIKSWGGEWTVETTTSTQILSANKSLSDFVKDGIAGVQGTISKDGNFVITAKILRAWGSRPDKDADGLPDNQDSDQTNEQEKEMREGHRGFPRMMMPPRLDNRGPGHGGNDNDDDEEDDNSGSN